jgi:hypothetical protein
MARTIASRLGRPKIRVKYTPDQRECINLHLATWDGTFAGELAALRANPALAKHPAVAGKIHWLEVAQTVLAMIAAGGRGPTWRDAT